MQDITTIPHDEIKKNWSIYADQVLDNPSLFDTIFEEFIEKDDDLSNKLYRCLKARHVITEQRALITFPSNTLANMKAYQDRCRKLGLHYSVNAVNLLSAYMPIDWSWNYTKPNTIENNLSIIDYNARRSEARITELVNNHNNLKTKLAIMLGVSFILVMIGVIIMGNYNNSLKEKIDKLTIPEIHKALQDGPVIVMAIILFPMFATFAIGMAK